MAITIDDPTIKRFAPLVMNALQPPAMPPETQAPTAQQTPMPTPAQAGYRAFAADPQHQQRAANAITTPGQPINPPPAPAPKPAFAPLPSTYSVGPAPDLSGIAPMGQGSTLQGAAPSQFDSIQPLNAALAQYQQLQGSKAGVDGIRNPWLRTLAKVGDVAGSILAPGVVAAIPGTRFNHIARLNMAEDRVQEAFQNAEASQSLRKAQQPEVMYQQTDDGLMAVPKGGTQAVPVRGPNGEALGKASTAKQATWSIHDSENGPIRVNNQTGEAQAVTVNGSPIGPKQKLAQSQPIMGSDGKPHTYMLNDRGEKIVDLGEHYERPITVHNAAPRVPRQMVFVPDGNGGQRAIEVVPGSTVPANASHTPGGPKISVDEQKRADLAKNLNENLDAMEEILSRRPELFGPIAGRVTDAKAAFGTDDADVTTMMTIKHQLGMVAQGAHGMRSAQGVESAANSLLGGFHNSAMATRAALEAARKSAATFLDDANNPGASRGKTPSPNKANDPLGIR